LFFFEKKNQKTFANFPPHRGKPSCAGAARNRLRLFASFFQEGGRNETDPSPGSRSIAAEQITQQ
jgi:hypothetical protein